MLSRKRRKSYSERRSSSNDEDARAGHSPSSMQGYPRLPLELQHIIVDLACLLPTSSSRPSLFATDIPTILNLSRVCHNFRNQLQPRLYRNVSLNRPSALLSLYNVLISHPDRRALIKGIHIGPTDSLPCHWWPLSSAQTDNHEPINFIATSLDQSCLPSWFQDRHAFGYDQWPTFCRDVAIRDALTLAQRVINVDLSLPGRGVQPSSAKVGKVWVSRVFEVQAVLDLSLQELRTVEEANPQLVKWAKPGAVVPIDCRVGRCACYPALRIAGVDGWVTPGEDAPPGGVFRLSREDLLKHLARPGSLTDRFDHPIVFARSNFFVVITTPAGKGSRNHTTTGGESGPRYEVRSDDWAGHEEYTCPDLAFLERQENHQLGQQILPTASFGSTLRLARSLLRLTTNFETLSLTGYLERALDPATDRNVRHLSLGPAPPGWDVQLVLHELLNLEKLRIAGASLIEEELESIVGSMKRLKELEWSLLEKYPDQRGGSIAEAVQLLLQGEAPGSGNSGEQSALLIVARLHPSDVTKVLATAGSIDTRSAWLEGRQFGTSSASPRLRLEAHAEASSAIFYEELKEWWLRVAS